MKKEHKEEKKEETCSPEQMKKKLEREDSEVRGTKDKTTDKYN